jgi:hypothetical protein
MRNTFLNRVSAERRVLTVVNSFFTGNQQLAGLSQAALLRWESAVGSSRVVGVLPILMELAEQCRRLSDRSGETFMSVERDQDAKILKDLELLGLELRKSR